MSGNATLTGDLASGNVVGQGEKPTSHGSRPAADGQAAGTGSNTCCVLVNMRTGAMYDLPVGPTVVGRCSDVVTGFHFVNVEPCPAISRSHATITTCKNGDVWVEDNGSTNGTSIASTPDAVSGGLRLIPRRVYLLPPGGVVVFGEVPMTVRRFELPPHHESRSAEARGGAAGSGGGEDEAEVGDAMVLNFELGNRNETAATEEVQTPSVPPPPPAEEERRSSRISRVPDSSLSVAQQAGVDATAKNGHSGTRPQSTSSSGPPQDPVVGDRAREEDGGRAAKGNAKRGAASAAAVPKRPRQRRARNQCSDDDNDDEAPPAVSPSAPELPPKSARQPSSLVADAHASRPSSPATGQRAPQNDEGALDQSEWWASPPPRLWVCFSGLVAGAKERAMTLVTRVGGRVLDEWAPKCSLLVVPGSPAVRTPKVLMAIGCGVPVVTLRFIEMDAPFGALHDFVPAVERTTGSPLDASRVLARIGECRARRALSGGVFHLAAVSAKSRGVAAEIIAACGGVVSRAKAPKEALVKRLNDESLQGLYDEVIGAV